MADETKTPIEIANQRIIELEEKSEGQIEGLADRLSSAFWDKLKEIFYLISAIQWDDIGTSLETAMTNASQDMIARILPEEEEDVADWISKIQGGTYDPIAGLKELQSYAGVIPGVSFLLRIGFLLLTASGVLKANLGAAWELGAQTVNAIHRPSIIPLEQAIDALHKQPEFQSTVKNIMDRIGLSDQFQEIVMASSVVPLDINMARQALLRGLIDDSKHDEILRSHHVKSEDIAILKELYEVIPPVQDIITMAVREVFSPEIVARFGQMEGMPSEFAEWAEKQGLSSYWARAYWASHWRLPSIGQGFEMLHRRVIDDNDLDLLLRAADIMPFWRDKLTAISYVPLTRVDVRRMYALGVLNEEGVYDAYLDHGYSPENATLMTEFTIAYTSEKERDLTKTDILALFKKYAIEYTTATEMLMQIGYSEDNATLLLYRAVSEMEATDNKKRIGYIEKAYVAGKITESEALSQLGKLDLASGESNFYIDSWNLAKQNKVRALTLDQIKAFYLNDIISESECRDELKEVGYNVIDTERFIQLFNKEQV